MKDCALGIISAKNTVGGDFGLLLEGRTIATLPFAGRYRLIDFALSNMVNAGITTVGVIAPDFYRSLVDHVGSGKPWDLDRKIGGLFVMPGTTIGTRNDRNGFLLGDIRRNFRIFRNCKSKYMIFSDTACVMNADFNSIVAEHEMSGCDISLLYKRDPFHRNGRLTLDVRSGGRVAGFGGTSDVFLGVMVVNTDFFIGFAEQYKVYENYDILDIFTMNASRLRIHACEHDGYVGIIDSVDDYFNVSMGLIADAKSPLFADRPIYTKVQDEMPCRYGKGASVRNSIVASGCIIEGRVENSILFRSVHVAKGSVVENSIVMQHSVVGRSANLSRAVLDKYVEIGDGKTLRGSESSCFIVSKGNRL